MSTPPTTQRLTDIEEGEASVASAPLDTEPAEDEAKSMADPVPPELIATISDLKEAVVRFDERTKYLGEQIVLLNSSLSELRQEIRDNRMEVTSTVEALRQEAKADREQFTAAVQGLRTELSSALTEMRSEARKDQEQFTAAVQGLRTELSSALTEMRSEARKDREQFTTAMTTLQQESEAGRVALASTLQEVNLSLTGAIGNLNDWTKRHADDIATLRSEGIGKTAFWSGISIIVALILGLAAIYFSTMKP